MVNMRLMKGLAISIGVLACLHSIFFLKNYFAALWAFNYTFACYLHMKVPPKRSGWDKIWDDLDQSS